MLSAIPDQASPPPAAQLPEIGRIRAISPSCIALQDIVLPSFAAAARADKEFAQAAPQFAAFAEARDAAKTLPTGITKASGHEMQTKLIAADPDSSATDM